MSQKAEEVLLRLRKQLRNDRSTYRKVAKTAKPRHHSDRAWEWVTVCSRSIALINKELRMLRRKT